MHGQMRNILFTTQRKDVAWAQREMEDSTTKTTISRGLIKQLNPPMPLRPQAFDVSFVQNIQDMLQIIHRTLCHSKYTIFSSRKRYA